MEVSVKVEIPDGWELADDRIRHAKDGEHYIAFGNLGQHSPRRLNMMELQAPMGVIVRPAWKWPEWLTAPWLTMNAGGDWWASQLEPQLCIGKSWERHGLLVLMTSELFNFTPPPCDDWRNSKRRNPNLNPSDD